MLNAFQERLNKQFRKTSISGPPAPWLQHATLHAGGLQAVGFTEAEEYLLVISADGRGLFELPSGHRVARDRDFAGPWWDVMHLRAQPLAPAKDEWVTVAGIHGGGLLRVTEDGWSLERIAPDWPNEFVFLFPPGATPFAVTANPQGYNLGPFAEGEAIRAYGFSPSGSYFLIATGAEVFLFGRASGAR